jgi:hypothetical protein
MAEVKGNIEHVDADDYKDSDLGEDPNDDTFNVTVSIPETVEIKMVNASTLSDYEVWGFISSILSNAFIGFWTAYFTNTDNNKASSIFFSSIVFTILFIVACSVTYRKRGQLQKKSKDIRLKTTPFKKKTKR